MGSEMCIRDRHSRKEEMRKNIVELEVHLGDDLRLTGFGFAGVYTHQ